MVSAGSCPNCSANWRGMTTKEEEVGSVIFLTRVCQSCGFEEDTGECITKVQKHLAEGHI